jgi:cytochrome c peroxidase
MSMAQYETGPEVSPFNSKFDNALAHPTQRVLSAEEQRGWELFRSKGKCNTCHLDGTENRRIGLSPSQAGGDETENQRIGFGPSQAADLGPLFSDFKPANLGVPQNFALPYLYESHPDQFGFVANPLGLNYVDLGVGNFLRGNAGVPVPNASWMAFAPQFDGKVQVPTLRNVDMRPRPDFVKAYMHNGYFKSLKAVVHFYNTRDTLNRGMHLPAGLPGEGTRYWPPPEVPQNLDRTIGNLGLSDSEENAIVAFLAVSGPRARGRPRVPRLRRGCRRA